MSKEVLNYTCENGHKWKSKKWPVSYEGSLRFREKQTKCPVCNSSKTMCISEDGKQGAVHIGFKK